MNFPIISMIDLEQIKEKYENMKSNKIIKDFTIEPIDDRKVRIIIVPNDVSDKIKVDFVIDRNTITDE